MATLYLVEEDQSTVLNTNQNDINDTQFLIIITGKQKENVKKKKTTSTSTDNTAISMSEMERIVEDLCLAGLRNSTKANY